MASWTPISEVATIIKDLEAAFKSGKTLPIKWRKEQLKQLWRMLDENEAALQEALLIDLGKSKHELTVGELGTAKSDVLHTLKGIDSWTKTENYDAPPPYNFWQPTLHKQPKGTALIITPWNFPIGLPIGALVGAMAAGCTVIVKPSEIAKRSSEILAELIPKYLDKSCFKVLLGDKDIVTQLLKHPFGHIAYIGGGKVGKIIAVAAAKTLTPVTLELGGKSPVIVSEKANIALATKRIVWAKHFSASQLCIAPDYALVHESVKEEFLVALTKEIETNYGPETHKNMGHIINKQHYERIMSLLKSTKGTIYGGSGDPKTNFIELTLISNLSPDDILFNDEIFGPLLPILTYQSLSDIPSLIDKIAPTPLALYLMSEDQSEASYIVDHTSSGGVSINDIYSQAAVPGLAFGGVGTSGNGKMHGKAGFDIFTNEKAVCTVPTGAEYEAMTDFRYSMGDLEGKYQMLKGMEEKLV